MLHKPGIEGLYIFLNGCVSDPPQADVADLEVDMDTLTEAYQRREWAPDKSLTLTDIKDAIKDCTRISPAQAEESTCFNFSETIFKRVNEGLFPPIHPNELTSRAWQESAENILLLIGGDSTFILNVKKHIKQCIEAFC